MEKLVLLGRIRWEMKKEPNMKTNRLQVWSGWIEAMEAKKVEDEENQGSFGW
jgi:hypothetical protein